MKKKTVLCLFKLTMEMIRYQDNVHQKDTKPFLGTLLLNNLKSFQHKTSTFHKQSPKLYNFMCQTLITLKSPQTP